MERTNSDINIQCGNTVRSEGEIFSVYLLHRSMKNFTFNFYLFHILWMKRSKKYLVFYFMLLIFGLQLNAQEKWTLNECISFAIKNNLQLHDAELTEQYVSQSFQQSKFNLLPGISAGSDAGKNYGRSVDPNTNGIVNNAFFNNSYYLNASVDVFRGFMLQNQIRYQKFRKEAAKNYRDNAVDDLAFQVMDAFYNVIYQEEMLKIANEQKDISELNLKKMDILVTNGLKAQTDLLEVKANYERDELFCLQTSNNIAAARITLKKAMNLPFDQPIILSNEIGPTVEIGLLSSNVSEVFESYSKWSPNLLQFQNQWEASLKNVSIQKAEFFPSIRFQASYNTGFYETNKAVSDRTIAFNSQIKNNQREFVGAVLSINP